MLKSSILTHVPDQHVDIIHEPGNSWLKFLLICRMLKSHFFHASNPNHCNVVWQSNMPLAIIILFFLHVYILLLFQLKNTEAFWIVFTVLHVILISYLCLQIYYVGRFKFGECRTMNKCSDSKSGKASGFNYQTPQPRGVL